MFAFARLLYNFQGGEMCVCVLNIKAEALAKVLIFQTTFRHQEGYYTTNTQTKISF
jgi:hypothetical protein